METLTLGSPNQMDLQSELETQSVKTAQDPVLAVIGNVGKFQWLVLLVLGAYFMPNAWTTSINAFLNVEADFWCQRPEGLQKSVSSEEWKNMSGQIGQTCQIYQRSYQDLSEEYEPHVWKECHHWEYDQSQFSRTITSDWNLVCEDAYLVNLSQTAYFMGQLCGIVVCGILCDKLGRKSVLITMTLCSGVSGVLCSLITSYTGFLILRFTSAFCTSGAYEAMFSYLLEIAGGKWSSVMSQGFFIFWPIGWIALAPIAYYVKDWRDLTLLISLPHFLIIILHWFLPESPKWLLATGRQKRAEAAVRKIDLINGQQFHFYEGWKLDIREGGEKIKSHDQSAMVWDLFRYPILRAKMSVLLVNWLVISMTYYGISLNSGQLGGNLFVNYVVNGLVEIPSYMAAMVLMNVWGRRWTLSISLITAGITLVSIVGIDQHLWNGWGIMAMVFLGKAVISCAFGVMYAYTAELCPTTIRSTGVGISSCFSRMGPMIAPWIGMLGRYHPCIPLIIWGLMAIGSGFVAMALPETNGAKLPDTFEESEAVLLNLPGCFGRSNRPKDDVLI